MSVAGSAVGVFAAGRLRTAWGSFGEVMALLWIGPLLAGTLAVVWLTERSGRELEELHPADAAPHAAKRPLRPTRPPDHEAAS